MLALEATDSSIATEKKLFDTLIELLNYEKITFMGKSNNLHHDIEQNRKI